MHKLLHFSLYISCCSLMGCGGSKVINKNQIFEDDITIYRIKTPIIPKEQDIEDHVAVMHIEDFTASTEITEELDYKLEKISEQNGSNTRYTQGYRVLIYSGKSREKADNIAANLREMMEDRVELYYDQPNYKVKVGNYLSKLEAHSICSQLQEVYPLAIIVGDKIKIDWKQYTPVNTTEEE